MNYYTLLYDVEHSERSIMCKETSVKSYNQYKLMQAKEVMSLDDV